MADHSRKNGGKDGMKFSSAWRKRCHGEEEVGNGEGWDAWLYSVIPLYRDSAVPYSLCRWLGHREASRWECMAGSRRSGRGRTWWRG